MQTPGGGGDLNGKTYNELQVKCLTSMWARKNYVTSGVTTLVAPDGADIDNETNELVIPTGAAINLFSIDRNPVLARLNATVRPSQQESLSTEPKALMYPWNCNLPTGVRTVLVIRVVAKDSSTTATEAALADDITVLAEMSSTSDQGMLQGAN